jgi:hypothetical protein
MAEPRRKTLASALREGIGQIRKGDYIAELRAAGADPVHALAVAFDGKRVRVEAVGPAKVARKKTTARKTARTRSRTRR